MMSKRIITLSSGLALLLIGITACSDDSNVRADGPSGQPDGPAAEAGPSPDSGTPDGAAPDQALPDGAQPGDTGMADAAKPKEASTLVDAAKPKEASTLVDAAKPKEASTLADAAKPKEASTLADAAKPADSAPLADATKPPDSVQPADSWNPCGTPPDGGVACNSVTQLGAVVPVIRVAQNLPAFTGGTIPDGTYILTAATKYTGPGGATGPSGATRQMTVVKTGTTYQSVMSNNGCAGQRYTETITISGSSLLGSTQCPSSSSYSMPFSCDGTTLSIAVESDEVQTFVKQ